MAYWKKCPECGETNYHEVGYTQNFECGFRASNYSDRREAKCGASRRRSAKAAAPASDATAPYRLALLDAARVADAIAVDMEAARGSDEHSARCRELAEQMRAFAGHGPLGGGARFDDHSGSGAKAAEKAVSKWVRKLKPW